MLESCIRLILKGLLSLRYSIEVRGFDKIITRGNRRVLFLPNHPALIDPVIMMSLLHRDFHPRPLADKDQVDRPLIRQLMKMIRTIIIPDLSKYGRSGRDIVVKAMRDMVKGLKNGDNLLIYPSGRAYRSHKEEIGGNSAVEYILKEMPDVRVVLIRSAGLWGSSFSWADGKAPMIYRYLKKYIFSLLANGIFFCPRRRITVEFLEPHDFPRQADRLTINNYLETYYNKDAGQNTWIPYFWWQGRSPKILPEPKVKAIAGDLKNVPKSVKKQVIEHLKELTGVSDVKNEDRLARDLGMDSLSMVETMVWLEKEFGLPQEDMQALQTVEDCLLAACGKSVGQKGLELKSIPKGWYKSRSKQVLTLHPGLTIAETFLNQAKSDPKKVIVADQLSGAKTNREIVTAIMALKPELEKLPGPTLGIMLPASLSAGIAYLSVMFAGKTPVMVNWTVGIGQMQYCLKQAGVTHVVTAKALVEKLKTQDMRFSAVGAEWIFLEEMVGQLSLGKKIAAIVKSRLSWSCLYDGKISGTAAIVFTSGSEADPKGVPLSHNNILSNIRDFTSVLPLRNNDRLLGMLPPFHSLGLTCTLIMPFCIGTKTVYHVSPTDAVILSRLIDSYKATLVVGTPTFLNGIVQAGSPEQLKHLRLIFTGAEKCPDYVYDAFDKACPQTILCEGYGITECSPVVSLNHDTDPHRGTIGKVLPSLQYAIVHPETGALEKIGNRGLLLVRGPSVFAGYLHGDRKEPFVAFEKKEYFNTGDLVCEDKSGVLTFCGRLKRTIKLGGEMISLAAIESALDKHFPAPNGEGPVLAVEAASSEDHPEVVLFTTLDMDRETANQSIRQEGLSALHNIRRLKKLNSIPLLGTGKTDYKALKGMLTD